MSEQRCAVCGAEKGKEKCADGPHAMVATQCRIANFVRRKVASNTGVNPYARYALVELAKEIERGDWQREFVDD